MSERFRVGYRFHAERFCNGGGAIAEVGIRQALDAKDFERRDGQKHIDIDVGDHGLLQDRGMPVKRFGTEQAFFFWGKKNEENGALKSLGMGLEVGSHIEDERGT